MRVIKVFAVAIASQARRAMRGVIRVFAVVIAGQVRRVMRVSTRVIIVPEGAVASRARRPTRVIVVRAASQFGEVMRVTRVFAVAIAIQASTLMRVTRVFAVAKVNQRVIRADRVRTVTITSPVGRKMIVRRVDEAGVQFFPIKRQSIPLMRQTAESTIRLMTLQTSSIDRDGNIN
jgi:hypothetical protein